MSIDFKKFTRSLYSFYQISSGGRVFMVKALSIEHAFVVLFKHLEDDVTLEPVLPILKVGDHSNNVYYADTRSVLEAIGFKAGGE